MSFSFFPLRLFLPPYIGEHSRQRGAMCEGQTNGGAEIKCRKANLSLILRHYEIFSDLELLSSDHQASVTNILEKSERVGLKVVCGQAVVCC